MNKEQLFNEVFNLIDENSENMSREEYADLLSEIASDCSIREEAIREEINNEDFEP